MRRQLAFSARLLLALVGVVLLATLLHEVLVAARLGAWTRAGLRPDVAAGVAVDMLLAGGLAMIAAVGLALLLGRALLRPLDRAIAAAARIAAGDYGVRLGTSGDRDLDRLATALDRLAERLEQEERTRRDLVGDVAHELRNPLATLQGYVEAMRDGVLEPGPEALETLAREIQRLARLVDDLQELNRIERRDLTLHIEPVDLREAVEAALALRQAELAAGGYRLEVAVPAGLPPLAADRDRLAQVLGNLLDNAIRYTPGGGRIRMEAAAGPGESGPSHVVWSVGNSGPGLSEEEARHVFDRFYRAERSRARSTGGAGLGLAIVRGLVEMHGGQIGVTSEPRESDGAAGGRWTEFRLRWPAWEGGKAAQGAGGR
ncbi:MAG: HAMP domain-containing protein [Clostridia bacterium]|nr:HAMP domain-containing protein [Clostridia bacterium]